MTRASCIPLVLSLLALACGGGDRDAEGRPSEVVPEIEVAPAPSPVTPSLYDEEGNLRASDERVAGLTLPVGLTPSTTRARVHTYVTDVPLPRLLRYFGPRLTTGQVEERPGGGAVYRNAVPREVTGPAVRLDVTLLPVPQGRSLVEIDEIEPEPTTPVPEDEALQRLEEAMSSAE